MGESLDALTQHIWNWPVPVHKEPEALLESELLTDVPLWLVLQLAKGRQGKRNPVYPKYVAYVPLTHVHGHGPYNPSNNFGFAAYTPHGPFEDTEASDDYAPGPVDHSGRPWTPLGAAVDALWQPQDARKRALERKYRKQAQPSEKEEAGPGNLSNQDYIHWIGQSSLTSKQRRCRWCHMYFYSREDGLAHYVEGQNCGWFLRQLYKYCKRTSAKQQCMVCRMYTSHQIWGVWLCNNRNCIRDWKFGEPSGHLGFKEYREMATKSEDLWNL